MLKQLTTPRAPPPPHPLSVQSTNHLHHHHCMELSKSTSRHLWKCATGHLRPEPGVG